MTLTPTRVCGIFKRTCSVFEERGIRSWLHSTQWRPNRAILSPSPIRKRHLQIERALYRQNKRTRQSHTCYVAFGSNVGDRLANVEEACRQIDKLDSTFISRTSGLWETDPMYVEDQNTFLNGVCEVTTTLEPLELLDALQMIEVKLKRRKIIDKGPRSIDLDILLYDDVHYQDERLTIPHPLMHERTFVLLPLCEIIPNNPINHSYGNTPKSLLSTLQQDLKAKGDTSSPISPISIIHSTAPPIYPLNPFRKTRTMSILNMTPDSFSDGGKHSPYDSSYMNATISTMVSEGAEILDIGGESTRPGSTPVSASEELKRILPSIKIAARHANSNPSLCISIDTYRASVAMAALDAGAHMINDVSGGLLDPLMLESIATKGASVILGHIRGTPQTMTSKENSYYKVGSVAQTVANELLLRVEAAETAGIRRWRILLDPGFGFAKNYDANVELLRDFGKLRTIVPELTGIPWVAGLSRKKFVRRLAGLEDESGKSEEQVKWFVEKGTDGALMASVYGGADVIRVHDVRQGTALSRIGEHVWRK